MRGLRIVLVLLVLLLGWLQYRLWFGTGGAAEVSRLEAQVAQQAHQNEGLRARNAALAAEVADLKSPTGEAAVEERARSELGMIRPGEVFYRVVETPAAAPLPEAPDEGARSSP
ncbi:cell division protein FtsB [Luteimonas sp. RD2P54]|uniref:Cell division protein FtsB n=1 Tax=Luteimonas endophytica TaxID=3042023 RepID=A0ABT6JC47_9GAMM|nr:cell division protein FtsB [Luteimonas endophytica]MDH5824401.1 cell division protein FtsB [Luteimonas endophytica]